MLSVLTWLLSHVIKIACVVGRGDASMRLLVPWGVLCQGTSCSEWGHLVFRELSRLRSSDPSRDFFNWQECQPHWLLRCARFSTLFGQVSWSAVAGEYTLHSRKCAMLTWAQQAGVRSRDSATQGHHREPHVNKAFRSMDAMMCFHNCVVNRLRLRRLRQLDSFCSFASWSCSA